MTRSFRQLLLASTAATLIGYAGGAAAQTAVQTANPTAVPSALAQLQQINSQLNTSGTVTGTLGNAGTTTTVGAADATASSSLNTLSALSLANQRNTGISLSSAASASTGFPGAAAIGSLQTTTGANVTATGIDGRITTENTFAPAITAPLTSSRDAISVAAGLNQAVNSIEGAIPLSLAGGVATGATSLSSAGSSSLNATLSILSSQVSTNAVGGVGTVRALADGNQITVTASNVGSGLSGTSALLSQGSITAGFTGNDVTNTIIANGGDSLNVSAAIGNLQSMGSTGLAITYDVLNNASVLRTNVGTAGLAGTSVAAVDGGTIASSSRLNVASNILGTADGEFMNGEGRVLSGVAATGTTAAATADYVVANLQTLTLVDNNAATSNAQVQVTLGASAPIAAGSIARVASNTVSSEAIGNTAANTVALGSNSSVAPTIAVVSSQSQGNGTALLTNSATTNQAALGVIGTTVANAGLMQVTGNTVQAVGMGNTASNVAALSAGGATSGGQMFVFGRQETASLLVTADIVGTGTTTLTAVGGTSTGRFEMTNNTATAEAVQNNQTNTLVSSGVVGGSALRVTNEQTAAGATPGGGAQASYLQDAGSGNFATVSQTLGADATLLSSGNAITVMAANNRSTNDLIASPLNPVTGNSIVSNTQTTTSQLASATVTGNADTATMLASGGTGANNTVTSFNNSISATAMGNSGTSRVGTTRFSSFR